MDKSFDSVMTVAAKAGWDSDDIIDRVCDFVDSLHALDGVVFPVDAPTLLGVFLELKHKNEQERRAAFRAEKGWRN